MCVTKKLRLLDENVYTPKSRRKPNKKTYTPPKPPKPPDPPNPPTPPDPNPQQYLRDKDGLDMAYAQNLDMLLLKGTMYISGTRLNRMSYIYI